MVLEWTEYISLVLSLAVSVIISFAVYQKDRKCENEKEKKDPKFSVLPIIASLIASSTSGVSLLGKPAEAYQFGINFQLFYITVIIVSIFTGYLFMPLVYKMKGPSIYEYFRLRFNSKIEKMAIFQFILIKVFATALTALPPALVLKHFSGVSLSLQLIMLISLTTGYTMIGGLKGVVWTDTFQSVIIFLTLIVLIVTSTLKLGGVTRVFQLSYDTDRLSWTIPSFDPSERLSIWAFLTGFNMSMLLNQSWYQRIRTLRTHREINITLLSQAIGTIIIGLCSCFMGLSIYAYYYGCDPKEAKLVDSYSNIVVYWLDDVGRKIPGLRGVYIAGITCASISTMSTNLNTVATMIVDDFRSSSSRNTRMIRIRIWTILVGAITVGIALVIQDAQSLVELTYVFLSLDGMTSGLFILGALYIPANSKGAMAGGVMSLIVTLFLIFGTSLTGAKNAIARFDNKPMSTEFCPLSVTNNTISDMVKRSAGGGVFFLFKISPFVYSFVSLVTTVGVGVIVSLIYEDKDWKGGSNLKTSRNPDLYLPYVHRFLPKIKNKDNQQVPMTSKESTINERVNGLYSQ